MHVDSVRSAAGVWATAQSVSKTEISQEQKTELVHAVSAVNETAAFGEQYELTFEQDRASRRPLLKLVNRDTHEVVRQIPPEYVLRLARELNKRK